MGTTSSTSQSDQPRSHSECLSQVFTRSRVLVMSSLDVLNKVRSSPDQTSSSLLLVFLENASPSKCITRPSTKPDQVTTLVSTSRDSQKRTCLKLETLCLLMAQMEMMIHQKLWPPTRLSCLDEFLKQPR